MAIRGSISTNKVTDEEWRRAMRHRERHQHPGDKIYSMKLGKIWHAVPHPGPTICGIQFGGQFQTRYGVYPDAYEDIKDQLCTSCFGPIASRSDAGS